MRKNHVLCNECSLEIAQFLIFIRFSNFISLAIVLMLPSLSTYNYNLTENKCSLFGELFWNISGNIFKYGLIFSHLCSKEKKKDQFLFTSVDISSSHIIWTFNHRHFLVKLRWYGQTLISKFFLEPLREIPENMCFTLSIKYLKLVKR